MLVSLGLDFRTARLEVRERFHLEDDDVPRLYDALAARGVVEAVVARTCNRMEAYCWWPQPSGAAAFDPAQEISRAWVDDDGSEAEVLRSNAQVRDAGDAARHLFRVAAGLESQILGDIHILGQLRRAFRDAVELQSVGSHLHRLFETALRVGKQVKRDTQLMTTRSSVGAEAARRARHEAGELRGRSCVVVGCGKSGTHAARTLAQLGADEVTLVNRTRHRAEKLARELGGAQIAGLDALPGVLASAEVVIVATGAQEPVLTSAALREARPDDPARRPLLVVDVSVPRNVEPSVGSLTSVDLIDLDSLHPRAAEVEKTRLASVGDAEVLVDQGVDEFVTWLQLAGARRAVQPFREIVAEICRREIRHLADEAADAERIVERIAARVMAHPMSALREASRRSERIDETTEALRVLFEDPRIDDPRTA